MPAHHCLPRKFGGLTGQDPVSHIACMGDYFQLHELISDTGQISNHKILIQRFKMSLEGAARRWVDTVKSTDYPETTKLFIRKYSGIGCHEANIARFRSLKWSESTDLETYRQTLTTLAEGLGQLYETDSSGNTQISKDFRYQFILGLPQDYQIALQDLSVTSATMETIMERVEKLRGMKKLKPGKSALAWDPSVMQAEVQQNPAPQDDKIEKLTSCLQNVLHMNNGNGNNQSSSNGNSYNQGNRGRSYSNNGNNNNNPRTYSGNRGYGNNQGNNRGYGNNQGNNQGYGNNQGNNQGYGNNQRNNQGNYQGYNQGNSQGYNRSNSQGYNRSNSQSYNNNQGNSQGYSNNRGNSQGYGNNGNNSQGSNNNRSNSQGRNNYQQNSQGHNNNRSNSQGDGYNRSNSQGYNGNRSNSQSNNNRSSSQGNNNQNNGQGNNGQNNRGRSPSAGRQRSSSGNGGNRGNSQNQDNNGSNNGANRNRAPTPGPQGPRLCIGCRSDQHLILQCPVAYEKLKQYFQSGQN